MAQMRRRVSPSIIHPSLRGCAQLTAQRFSSYACYKKHHEKCRWRDMRDHRPARRRTCMKRSLTVTQAPEQTIAQGVKHQVSATGAKFPAKLPPAGQMPPNPRKRSRSPSCIAAFGDPPSPEPDDRALSRRSSVASVYIPTPPTPKFVSDRAATPKATKVRQVPFDESSQQLPFGQFMQQLAFGQYTQSHLGGFWCGSTIGYKFGCWRRGDIHRCHAGPP